MHGLDVVFTPFQFAFMRQAFLISVLVCIPAALLSCFIILKGWALMGDALSHAVFPGVVISYILGWPYAVGGFIAGVICGMSSGALKENSRIKQDTAMGIVFSGMFGFGLVLFVKVQSSVHLDHILFGNMLGVSPSDIATAAIIAVLTAAIIAVKWRDLLLYAFDPAHAQAIGLRTGLLNFGLLALLSLTVVGALRSIGVIIVVALMIAPGATAVLLTRKFSAMLMVSVAIATTSSLCGVYASFFLDSAPGATVVLVMTAAFIVTLIATLNRQGKASRAPTDRLVGAGKGHLDRRAMPGFARYGERGAIGLDQGLGQGQAETGAGDRVLPLHGIDALKGAKRPG